MEIVGNNITSAEDEKMASFLKARNYQFANLHVNDVHVKQSFYSNYGKRILDLIIMIPSLLILSPLLIGLSLANLLNMGGPVFFKQSRIGYHGKTFNMIKFRSMKEELDENGQFLPGSQRLTNYGRFIRRFSLDELGNFFNILKGDMSIIGPRPMPVFFRSRMTDRHNMREAVRPGLECPRVIALKEEDVGEYHLQFENDIWYVENISLKTDIKMCLELLKMIFASKKRKYHAEVGTFFVGYNDKGLGISFRLAKAEYPDVYRKICEEISANPTRIRNMDYGI